VIDLGFDWTSLLILEVSTPPKKGPGFQVYMYVSFFLFHAADMFVYIILIDPHLLYGRFQKHVDYTFRL